MTNRAKRRLVVFAVAALLLGAAAGAAFWSQRLTAEERAYLLKWYLRAGYDVQTLTLTADHRFTADIGGRVASANDEIRCTWAVRRGVLMMERTYRVSLAERVAMTFGIAPPVPMNVLSSTFVATADSRPEGPVTLTMYGSPVSRLYRDRASAEAEAKAYKAGRSIFENDSPEPEEDP